MNQKDLVNQLKSSREYFERSSRELSEADSSFTPTPGVFTAANQVAHVAATVEWFMDGAFSPKGFDLDFEKMEKKIRAITSLTTARAWLDRAYAAAIEKVAHSNQGDLDAHTAAGPVMGEVPRWQAILGIIEHSAHHRGALSVYTRLLKKVPPMPYMEM